MWEGTLLSNLDMALDEDEWSATCFSHLPSPTGKLVGTRTILTVVARRKISTVLCRNQTPVTQSMGSPLNKMSHLACNIYFKINLGLQLN